MSDVEAKGTAKVVPIEQYYNDISRIIDDAEWMGDDDVVELYLPEKEQIRRQMDDGDLWYPNF
tara:strand:+ start:1195 stop:1383 length:189 start_codon:yes stop_codon:yes gene_type:complete